MDCGTLLSNVGKATQTLMANAGVPPDSVKTVILQEGNAPVLEIALTYKNYNNLDTQLNGAARRDRKSVV